MSNRSLNVLLALLLQNALDNAGLEVADTMDMTRQELMQVKAFLQLEMQSLAGTQWQVTTDAGYAYVRIVEG